MKVEWDYTALADAYLSRPAYAHDALGKIITTADLDKGARVCDIGAGVGHLAIPLAQAGFIVDAVEPNDSMRENGIRRTTNMTNVSWSEGTGEHTGKPAGEYDLVSFGSSFNVCDRQQALKETYRLLKSGRWFCCLWNHRDLDDPHQAAIEKIIADAIPGYQYGKRRESQEGIIAESKLFVDVRYIEGSVAHKQSIDDVMVAWRSHATLARQAKSKCDDIINSIEGYLRSLHTDSIVIPYTTRVWMARRID